MFVSASKPPALPGRPAKNSERVRWFGVALEGPRPWAAPGGGPGTWGRVISFRPQGRLLAGLSLLQAPLPAGESQGGCATLAGLRASPSRRS